MLINGMNMSWSRSVYGILSTLEGITDDYKTQLEVTCLILSHYAVIGYHLLKYLLNILTLASCCTWAFNIK